MVAAGGPSVTLPLRYLLAAAAAFVAAALGIVWAGADLAGHYYHPRVLALTHMVTLGWVTTTIMGASYQLLPIVLERPLWSERLARWQFAALVIGVVGVVGHFAIAQWSGFAWSAALVAAAALAHVVNVGLTVRGLRRWTFTARMLGLAVAAFGATAILGLTLGLDRTRGIVRGDLFAVLHAHVHLAVLGWVTPMILGVAARVYPMFLLASEPGPAPARVQLWGVTVGVPAVTIGVLVTPVVTGLGALAVAAAIAAHLVWLARVVRGRKRPALDWGLRFVLAGAAFLVPASALGLALAFDVVAGPRAALAYGVLVLGGWVSLTIVGMMLKIVPFLVWNRVYAPRAGRAPVPTLARLGWPAGEAVACALLVSGTGALAVAVAVPHVVAIRVAGAALSAGTLVFAAVLVRALGHLRGARAVTAMQATPTVSGMAAQ